MNSGPNRGIVDMASRVLESVMARPGFKEGLRTVLLNVDPDNAPALIRVLLSKDIEVPLAIVSSLPGMANVFIKMADELIRQVRGKFPVPLLEGFAESLLSDIDHEALARVMEGMKGLGRDLSPAFEAMLKALEARRIALREEHLSLPADGGPAAVPGCLAEIVPGQRADARALEEVTHE